jgi:hypothetical protein
LIAERTNFGHAVAMRAADVEDFLGRVLFPSHGLIVKSNAPRTIGPLFKGVTDREVLDKAVSTCAEASADGQALIQTDMRAHLNPTRMASLRELAERLAHRLNCLCPACKSPGFGRMDVMRGLPCSACGTPTDMVLAEILGCSACSLTQQRPRRDGLANAGQQFCPLCNP